MIKITKEHLDNFEQYRKNANLITRTRLNRFWIEKFLYRYVNKNKVKIFVEGYDDYIIFSKLLKDHNVIFLNGTSTLDLIDKVNKPNDSKFVLLVDNDDAGIGAIKSTEEIDYKKYIDHFKLNNFRRTYYNKLVYRTFIKKLNASIYLSDIYKGVNTTEDFIRDVIKYKDYFHEKIRIYKSYEDKLEFVTKELYIENKPFDITLDIESFSIYLRDLSNKIINLIFKNSKAEQLQIDSVINHFLLTERSIKRAFEKGKYKSFDVLDFVKNAFSNSNDMQVYKVMIAELAIYQCKDFKKPLNTFNKAINYSNDFKLHLANVEKYLIDPFIRFHEIFKLNL